MDLPISRRHTHLLRCSERSQHIAPTPYGALNGAARANVPVSKILYAYATRSRTSVHFGSSQSTLFLLTKRRWSGCCLILPRHVFYFRTTYKRPPRAFYPSPRSICVAELLGRLIHVFLTSTEKREVVVIGRR